MARVSYVEKENAPPMVKELYEKNEQRGGRVINLWKALGHLPYIGLNYQRMGNSILKGEELNPKLREIAVVRIGQLERCRYEFTQHSRIALREGVTKEQLSELDRWQTSKLFSDEERAVLAFADAVELQIQVPDATFDNLRKYLNEHQAVELTADIGYYIMTCRILEALKIDMESA